MRLSAHALGQQGNQRSSEPDVSADGSLAVFTSEATNLEYPEPFAMTAARARPPLPDLNGVPDIYVHDLATGLNRRVSVSTLGVEANGPSRNAAIDGSLVAFESDATNLVPNDTNGVTDVFVHDLLRGTTERVSRRADGTGGDGPSTEPAIHGSVVAFASDATNLDPGDTNGATDVFLWEPVARVLVRVSRAADGDPADGPSRAPSVGPGWVAFESDATNLVDGDVNGMTDVFAVDTDGTVLVSAAPPGMPADGPSRAPAVSPEGTIAFESDATNLLGMHGDMNDVTDVYAAYPGREMMRLSRAPLGEPDGPSYAPATGATGFAFLSDATNLVNGDTNNAPDVFTTGQGQLARASVTADGAQANGASGAPATSDDGTVVVFDSDATNLVDEDTNGVTDVFARLDLDACAAGEAGPVSGPVHDQVEPASGRAHVLVHRVNCDVVAANGL